MQASEFKLVPAVNREDLADNLETIAAYTVELHETLDDTALSAEEMEAAKAAVLKAIESTFQTAVANRPGALFDRAKAKFEKAAKEILDEIAQKAGLV